MPLSPGVRLGPYDVISSLGAGGMGEVYRARDTTLNRDVALKILPEAFATDPDRLARFRREAQVLASLNHPNIATIHGLEHSGAAHALVMELVEGPDLSELIGSAKATPDVPLSVIDALAIARQIALALEAAHEAGIIHRDLKPANIKVKADGSVKVLDFGLAKAMDTHGGSAGSKDPASEEPSNRPTMTSPATTGLGVILGTASYMSPEQARGRAVDKRGDLWAFGVVLLEMLTGRQVFAGDTVTDVIAAVVTREPDWQALPATTPAAIRRLLRRCLEKDPARRLRDAADARLEIEEALNAPAAEAEAHVPGGRLLWLAAAAIAGAVLTGAAWILTPAGSADDRVARLTLLAPDKRVFANDSGDSAISPDGRWVAFFTSDQSSTANDITQLWVRAIDSLSARLLAEGEVAHLPFWSPDSQRIGYFGGGKLKVLAVDGGTPVIICDARDGRGGSWSSKGIIVFAPSSGGALMRVSENGGDPQPVSLLDTTRGETAHRFPWFLPDGEHFLYVALPMRDRGVQVVIGQASSMTRKDLMVAQSAPVYASPGYLLFQRKTVLVAQRFDAQALALEGEPVPLADVPGYVGFKFTGGRALSASDFGDVLYTTDSFPNTTLEWRDLSGNLISRVDVPPGRYNFINLSPDSRLGVATRLSSSVTGDVWLFDLHRGGGSRLTSTTGLNYGGTISADGRSIVFSGNPEGIEYLYSVTAGGRLSPDPLFRGGSQFKMPLAWSADGTVVFYRDYHPETNNDLWIQPMTGTDRAPKLYLGTRFAEDMAAPSPDGKWLAYVSDEAEAGLVDAYVQPYPVPDAKTRVTTAGAQGIYWRKDSRQMLIVGADRRDLYLVDVEPGKEFRASRPRKAGRLPAGVFSYVASSDLTRLLVSIPEAGDVGSSLTLVQNWVAALGDTRK